MAAVAVEMRFHLRMFEKARLPCGDVFEGLCIEHPCECPKQPLDDEGIRSKAQLQATVARFEQQSGVACAAFYLAIVGAVFFWNRV